VFAGFVIVTQARRLCGGEGVNSWPWQRLLMALLWMVAGVGMAAEPPVRLDASTTKEYQVKAGFLINFIHFVEWPSTTLPEATTPISIGILGDDHFGPYLDEIIQGETIKNRPLLIKRSRTIEGLKACHVLFISKSEKNRLAQILASLGSASILTVSELEGFLEQGGCINFFRDGNKIRFEINPETGQHCGLNISSHLLRLAKVVSPTKTKTKK